MSRKYFSLEKKGETADLSIYGDITSVPWCDGDVSSASLSKQLEQLGDVTQLNVYINSYGGEVAEGVAIYNALKRHKAKVKTICDGFACSIASVIFMAGEERVMNEASMLMIHNAWTFAEGNAAELRKQADDLDKITKLSIETYKAHSDLTEEEIVALMDAETWILPEEALEYGFATSIAKTEKSNASQNAMLQLFNIVKAYQETQDENDDEDVDDAEKEPDDTLDDEEQPAEEETEETDEKTTEDEETEDNVEDTDDEENPAEEPVEAEETDEETEEEPEAEDAEEETEETDEETDEDKENPTQKWRGFFNSILKM